MKNKISPPKLTFVAALFALFVGCLCNQQVSIVGPRFITSNNVYKAMLDTQDLSFGSQLVVGLRSKNGLHGMKKITKSDEPNQQIEFNLPEDLHDSYKLMALLVKEKDNRKICYRKEVSIFTAKSKSYVALIQTDKPAYKPGDKVHFQVIVIDHQTKPFKYDSLKVDVLDTKGASIKTFNDLQQSEFSVYKNSFTLPDDPELGSWSLQVQVNGDGKISSKSFIVKDFKAPPFQVFVESPARVSFDGYSPSIELKVFAKYPFDMMVKGTATISSKVYIIGNEEMATKGTPKEIKIESGSKSVNFDIKNDLGLKYVPKPARVEFTVKFSEDGSGRSAEESHSVEVLPSGRYHIEVKKAKTFKPGFTYKIDVSVTTLDGELEKSTSKPLTMTVKTQKHVIKRDSVETKTSVKFLKDGKARFELKPAEDAISFEVKFEFEKAIVEDKVEIEKGVNRDSEWMQVSYEPEVYQIGKLLNITAETNSILDTLNVIVIGRDGLIYSEHFEETSSNKQHSFDLKIMPEMAPEATVFVFYVREQDGDVVFDHFNLELGYSSSNSMSIKPQYTELEPKKTASFTIKTEPNSFVSLLGVDHTIRYLGNGNEITAKEVNSKLSAKKSSENKLSNVVILQLAKSKKHECLGWEESLVADTIGSRTQVISVPEDVEEIALEENEIVPFDQVDPAEDMLRKYFPDVWFFETVHAEREKTIFSQLVPDTITTWMISGYSLNEEHGLAIAEPTQIKVFQEFFAKVGIPSAVKVGEVIKVDVTVFNYLKNRQVVEVLLESDRKEFQFVEERQIRGKSKECVEFVQVYNANKRINVEINSGSLHTFYVKALKSGDLKLKVTARGQGVEDKVEKVVKVDYEGEKQFKSSSMLIDLRREPGFSQDVYLDLPANVDPATVKVEATISGNVLGPSLENAERFISMPPAFGEEKLRNFASAIYAYKYLKSSNLINASLTDNALESMKKGYESIKKRQSLTGGFKLWSNTHGNVDGIWLTAYFAQLLGDASKFIEIDPKVIENTLDFLKNKLNTDGSFKDDFVTSRSLQGSPDQRTLYLTAFVMLGILKNDNFESFHSYVWIVNDGGNYLRSKSIRNDYEKAIAAYAFALNDDYEDNEKAKKFIDTMIWNFLNIPQDQIKSIQIEIASYAILACLKLGHQEDRAIEAFEWLMKQRKAGGGFFSSHDTVLGLQAISAMSEKFASQNVNLEVTLGRKMERIQSGGEIKSVELPANERSFRVTASGEGMAYVSVFAEFRLKSNEQKKFEIFLVTTDIEDGVRIDVRVRASVAKTNMAVMEVEIPSGYEYSKHKVSQEVKNVEVDDDKTQVTLYFDAITTTPITQSIELVKVYDVVEAKKSSIKVYDYYDPETYNAIYFYNLAKELNCGSSYETQSRGNFNDNERRIITTTQYPRTSYAQPNRSQQPNRNQQTYRSQEKNGNYQYNPNPGYYQQRGGDRTSYSEVAGGSYYDRRAQ